jgi:predicted DNA-binding transcriptional regulator YafY
MKSGDIVEIIYIDRQGELSYRHVRVVTVKNDRLVAYCYKRKRLRTFQSKNILSSRKVKAA